MAEQNDAVKSTKANTKNAAIKRNILYASVLNNSVTKLEVTYKLGRIKIDMKKIQFAKSENQ